MWIISLSKTIGVAAGKILGCKRFLTEFPKLARKICVGRTLARKHIDLFWEVANVYFAIRGKSTAGAICH